MKRIAIIYGSTTGTTEGIAKCIAGKIGLGMDHVFEVSKFTPALADNYDVLILGSSTWGDGELQDDWYDGIRTLNTADLSGKTVALFGCGDSCAYSTTFCDAMGEIYQELQGKGCKIVGGLSTDGYDFSDSKAVVDGQFVGAAVDEMNDSDKTDDRLQRWLDSFRKELE